jgi:Fe-S-cluster-containing dehydrogenase component
MSGQLTFDVDACTGCLTCAVACKHENRTPPGVAWLGIESREARRPDRILWLRRSCVHCPDAPCAEACPSGAIQRGASGAVEIRAEICQGCGSCAAACPRRAIALAGELDYFGAPLSAEPWLEPHQRHVPGRASKCTLCEHRTTAGLAPACVEACSGGALRWQRAAGSSVVYLASPDARAVLGSETHSLPLPEGSSP